jgi:hypothetical protein
MKDKNYELYFDNLLNNMLEGVAINQLIFDDNNKPIDYVILKVNDNYKKICLLIHNYHMVSIMILSCFSQPFTL